MHIDNTTLHDLLIFNKYNQDSLFSKLALSTTAEGVTQMENLFINPLKTVDEIERTQQILKWITSELHNWPTEITNGTLMVLQKMYETAYDSFGSKSNFIEGFFYSIFHNADFTLLKYNLKHSKDFLVGLQKIIALDKEQKIEPIQELAKELDKLKKSKLYSKFIEADLKKMKKPSFVLNVSYWLLYLSKNKIKNIITLFAKIDAWYGMALATKKFGFSFPNFSKNAEPFIKANKLYHPLVPNAVAYDVELVPNKNFLFLTGANMSGKSTLIRSLGYIAYLAHLGMGVPAENCTLSYFDALISNINIQDNVFAGQSYFYNEVHRVKTTTMQLSQSGNWLVLIDEIFKGTNIEDAQRCSIEVIKGFLKIKNTCFVLSTHLYEIGEKLKDYNNIQFKYFETQIKDGRIHFSYKLEDGISKDRLGYIIMQQEGVIDLLNKL